MGPPITSATSLTPGSHWYDLEQLCKRREEAKKGEIQLDGGCCGGRSQWGDGTEWLCSIGTLIINYDVAPCTPCQKIEYTCRDTYPTVHKETFCPVGAKYPDRRLNSLWYEPPAEGRTDDEIREPKKSCLEIKSDTIQFISALWKRDCKIKTNGELRDLLNEAGPHCGAINYTCSSDEGQSVTKEKQFCVEKMGTWEFSMRQFLLGLSPSCTVEGTGRTGQWWKYYHEILMKTDPDRVYGHDIMWGKEKSAIINDESLLEEYHLQKDGLRVYRKPPHLLSYARQVFYRNKVSPTASGRWQTMGGALRKVCSPIFVQGKYAEYDDDDDAKNHWTDAAEDRALETLLCPARELGWLRR